MGICLSGHLVPVDWKNVPSCLGRIGSTILRGVMCDKVVGVGKVIPGEKGVNPSFLIFSQHSGVSGCGLSILKLLLKVLSQVIRSG